ncbi:MAG: type restriction protein res subunit [Defluviitaleaceae bacterium]|jgi:superfamily II DNA or RNA helicase/HKD family nuclease|uniref:DEAD/DEAH box helicase family protein n=1 Tax=Thermosipho sp. (in: thermotogales) TaxID=1968895 RepID=UPI000EEA42E7|nr:DEAD/DEAH box helicase family protein [Thermosipho sp. (in: thermotogales)]MBZ4668759.1 type restriction protein res subunit [Defluviitaleaceae bacterium]HAA81076.1 DNA repair protein [Thermoanaerobacter sp.]
MSFDELSLKMVYRSSNDDIVRDFLIPALEKTVVYKRAVGFFSSTSLIEITKGLYGLVKNNGKIYIVASPALTKEDIEAIRKGYEKRAIIEKRILDSFQEPKDYFEEERLNLLAHLIAMGYLDIKLAFMENENEVGIYHEKIGIMIDKKGNKIAFTGSLNETKTAYMNNFESIDVFMSWMGEDSRTRVEEKEKNFDDLWHDRTYKVRVIDFPKVGYERLKKYMKPHLDLDIDKKQFFVNYKSEKRESIFVKPQDLQFRDYQLEAIENWLSNNGQGIFNMATGTGKTVTALGAISKLAEKLNYKIAVVIVCPFQHLVEQWAEEVCKWNVKPIIGYSGSSQKEWLSRLKQTVRDYNLGFVQNFCFITTNSTFSTNDVQKQLAKLNRNSLIVADEVHYFGAEKLSKKLLNNFTYRLGLSATIERHFDPEGTKKIYGYFGNECINYPIELAIKNGMLTPYYYYPIVGYLTEEELVEYNRLSRELGKYIEIDEDKYGNYYIILNEKAKQIALERAKIIAGAKIKLDLLKRHIKPYTNDTHILVYCGVSNMSYEDFKGDNDTTKFGIRQIDEVTRILGKELSMKVTRFTSRESIEEREWIKREFEKGEKIQAIVAIKCLDEGFNIPAIKTAFILASTTNPKEYIQRRGRILRLAKGKAYATIYDFVILPRPLEEVKHKSWEEVKYDISLVRREIARIEEFCRISLNSSEGFELISKIKEVYDMFDVFKGG